MMRQSFELSLIDNAAATLAGIKVGNLYNYRFSSFSDCKEKIGCVNEQLNKKGVYIKLLNYKDDFYLLYVYRKSELCRILAQNNVKVFLALHGYRHPEDEGMAVDFLAERIGSDKEFPHEIGVFLGYPLGDILGFIRNRGENCKYCGIWKVYCDEISSLKYFKKIERCRSIYLKVFNSGRSIYDMTVKSV
ncbi:MAG: DUF3793 family protein [Lachnospiraceae bacterium]|nr:DUF3793 family protein [Lachnospiraceae bacterium]